MGFRGNLPSSQPSQTDWERVKRDADSDAPIPYDPNDPDDGPYDPNDDAAVDAFLTEAEIWAGWPNQVLIKPAGKPVNFDADRDEGKKPDAKAS
jgi:hypothetical protein